MIVCEHRHNQQAEAVLVILLHYRLIKEVSGNEGGELPAIHSGPFTPFNW